MVWARDALGCLASEPLGRNKLQLILPLSSTSRHSFARATTSRPPHTHSRTPTHSFSSQPNPAARPACSSSSHLHHLCPSPLPVRPKLPGFDCTFSARRHPHRRHGPYLCQCSRRKQPQFSTSRCRHRLVSSAIPAVAFLLRMVHARHPRAFLHSTILLVIPYILPLALAPILQPWCRRRHPRAHLLILVGLDARMVPRKHFVARHMPPPYPARQPSQLYGTHPDRRIPHQRTPASTCRPTPSPVAMVVLPKAATRGTSCCSSTTHRGSQRASRTAYHPSTSVPGSPAFRMAHRAPPGAGGTTRPRRPRVVWIFAGTKMAAYSL